VAGQWGHDIGYQCGGWTVEWLGASGDITQGTTVLEAIRSAVTAETIVDFDPDGIFAEEEDILAGVGLVFLGETPYAEGFGDRADLRLGQAEIALLERMRRRCQKLIVVLITGRPLIISEQMPLMDALVVAWLPGSEGQGVADVLFGDVPFSGKLPYTWPRHMNQIPRSEDSQRTPLFPFDFGLS